MCDHPIKHEELSTPTLKEEPSATATTTTTTTTTATSREESTATLREQQAAQQDMETTIKMIQQERLPEAVVRATLRQEEGWEDRLLDKEHLEMAASERIVEGKIWVENPDLSSPSDSKSSFMSEQKGLALQLFRHESEHPSATLEEEEEEDDDEKEGEPIPPEKE